MRLLAILMVICLPAIGQTTVNAYIDFECGSNCIADASALTAGTHGSVGTWSTQVSLSDSSLTYGAITNLAGPGYSGAVKVGSVNYTGTGSRCLAMRHDQFEAAVLTWTSTHAQVCLSYMWSPGQAGASDFQFYDEVSMMGSSDYSVLSWEPNQDAGSLPATPHRVKVHTQAGTSSAINISAPTDNSNWFWVSQLYDNGNLAKIAIFGATNFTQIGSTVTLAAGAVDCINVHIGEHHSVTPPSGTVTYYDNMVVTFSASDFPLVPTNAIAAITSRSGPGRAIGRRIR